MPIQKTTAYQLLSCVPTSLRFTDSDLMAQLRKGRVAIGELCFVREASTCLSMMCCINTDDYIVIRYGCLHISENGHHIIMSVNSIHELIESIKSVADSAPRVLVILDTVNLLSGYRVQELEQLITNLMDRNSIVITNCSPLASLATQIINL